MQGKNSIPDHLMPAMNAANETTIHPMITKMIETTIVVGPPQPKLEPYLEKRAHGRSHSHHCSGSHTRSHDMTETGRHANKWSNNGRANEIHYTDTHKTKTNGIEETLHTKETYKKHTDTHNIMSSRTSNST
jgi:hypothetical protein